MKSSVLLLLGWCTFLSLSVARGEAATTFDVTSSEQLLSALRNQSITQIVVRSSVAIPPENSDWNSYSLTSPLVIRRNVTILSSPPGFTLDFNFMQVAFLKLSIGRLQQGS